MEEAINATPDGSIIIAAIKESAGNWNDESFSPQITQFFSGMGSMICSDIVEKQSWAFIGVKGMSHGIEMKKNEGSGRVRVEKTLDLQTDEANDGEEIIKQNFMRSMIFALFMDYPLITIQWINNMSTGVVWDFVQTALLICQLINTFSLIFKLRQVDYTNGVHWTKNQNVQQYLYATLMWVHMIVLYAFIGVTFFDME